MAKSLFVDVGYMPIHNKGFWCGVKYVPHSSKPMVIAEGKLPFMTKLLLGA